MNQARPSLRHLLATLLLAGTALIGQAADRPTHTLSNTEADLTFDLAGGSLRAFQLHSNPVNPFQWNTAPATEVGNRAQGHFLCLDRWGPPSTAEGARGMPYHGEAPNVLWSASSQRPTEATLTATLPMAGLRVTRHARLAPHGAACAITETVTNLNALGRPWNMVQHPTIAPPFLDATTLVDCNGRKGFAQGNPMPTPEEPSFFWPAALNRDGQTVNLRHLVSDPEPNVVSYAIDDRIGWITATSPSTRLLVGYAWHTRDYPWVSLWRDVRDGKPAARGLEFGTTGLHQPFPILLGKGRIFDRPTFQYLDAGESTQRSYVLFLLPIPADFRGVEQLTFAGDRLTLIERGGPSPRSLIVPLPPNALP